MGLVAYIESSWCLIRTKHLMLTAASGHCYTMRRRRDRNFVPGGSQLLVVYLRQRDWTNTIGRLLCESHQTNEAISVASQLKLTKLKKTYSNLLQRLDATSGNRCQSQNGLFSTIPAESTQAQIS